MTVASKNVRRTREASRPSRPEAAFQLQVTQLAELYGWQWMHVKPGLFADGRFATMVSGTMGRGWPDLTMVRPRDGRLLFAELKVPPNTLTDEQGAVLDVLRCVMFAEVYIWRPADWPAIQGILK